MISSLLIRDKSIFSAKNPCSNASKILNLILDAKIALTNYKPCNFPLAVD